MELDGVFLICCRRSQMRVVSVVKCKLHSGSTFCYTFQMKIPAAIIFMLMDLQDILVSCFPAEGIAFIKIFGVDMAAILIEETNLEKILFADTIVLVAVLGYPFI